MRGVENHGAAGIPHHREAAHVHDEVVVAEAEAALANHDLLVARALRLLDHVAHLPGRQELALLDIQRLALLRGIADEIRLPAEEGRGLDDIHDRGDLRQRRVLVNVGEDRHSDFLFYFRKHFQAFCHAGPPVALARGAVRLVERALEDIGHAELAGVLLQLPRDIQAELLALQRVRARNKEQRPVEAGLEAAQLHAATTESLPSGDERFAAERYWMAALTKALNNGCPPRGVEVNSGWNCTPKKNRWPGSSIISGRFSLGVRAETL